MATLEDPIPRTSRTEIGGLIVDEQAAGSGRVKRVIYPPGWVWRRDMQPITGTDWCTHTHIGFLAQGTLGVEFSDGCKMEASAPTMVVTEPGHAAWVVGDEAAVIIQVDCGKDTEAVFQMADHTHRHVES